MDTRELIFNPQYGQAQSKAYTATAGTIDNALPKGTTAVWVWTTTDAHVKVGSAPTATTADFPLPAMTPMVLPVNGKDVESSNGAKVSAVQVSAGGTLYVCPI